MMSFILHLFFLLSLIETKRIIRVVLTFCLITFAFGEMNLSTSSKTSVTNQKKYVVKLPNSNILHMVYESDGKVYYSYSLDDGKVWFPPQFVSRGKCPSLILQWTPGTNNYVPWVAYLLNDTIICAIWEPTGWRYHKVFEGNPPSLTCGPPSLCRGDVEFGTYCYVVYSVHQGNPPTNNYIYFNEVFYNGAGEHFIVEEAGAEICRSPSIASIPSPLGFFYEAHVVWERGDRIYYRMRDILRNWLPIERISTEPPLPKTEPASNPSIEWYGEYLLAAWRGPNEYGDPIGDIWRRARIHGGLWERPINQSETPTQESDFPVMSTNFATVWQEEVPEDNWDIWVKFEDEPASRPLIQTLTPSTFPQIYGYWEYNPNSSIIFSSFILNTIWAERIRNSSSPLSEVRFHRYLHPNSDIDMAKFYSVEVGGEEPSLYCEERDGFIRYGEYSIDYGNENLRYRLRYLDPRYYYLVRAVVYRRGQNNWIEEFYSDTTLIATLTFEPNRSETLWFILPKESYQDSCEAVLEIEKVVGSFASIANLTLFQLENLEREPGGGQSGGNFLIKRGSLHKPSPNPFRSQTVIRYQLPDRGKVSIMVYDASGRIVRRLLNENKEAGSYNISWDGRDDRGKILPAGVYFYRLKTERFTDTKRAVLIR